MPYGMITNTKIKTQCALRNVPELVGSPAVLFYRVSNLPLRVVHSLFINYSGGLFMDKVSEKLTVLFENPFWVGVFERIENGKLSVAKVTFGAEPKEYEIQEYIQKYYFNLQFSPAVDVVVKEAKRNPKRIQRDARKQIMETGIGTKSQQALKLQHEQNKQERRVRSREQKEAEAQRMFELKQQKRRQKHKGH